METVARSFTFPFGQLFFHDWYFRLVPSEDIEFDVENIQLLMQKCIGIQQGRRFCMLVDAEHHVKATTEAREWAAKAGYNDHLIARAILTNSLAMKMTANFFIRFNKPVVETRLFTSEKDALLWLEKKYRAANP